MFHIIHVFMLYRSVWVAEALLMITHNGLVLEQNGKNVYHCRPKFN